MRWWIQTRGLELSQKLRLIYLGQVGHDSVFGDQLKKNKIKFGAKAFKCYTMAVLYSKKVMLSDAMLMPPEGVVTQALVIE